MPLREVCATIWTDEDDPVITASTYDEGEPEQCEECGRSIESSYGPVE